VRRSLGLLLAEVLNVAADAVTVKTLGLTRAQVPPCVDRVYRGTSLTRNSPPA
jgi:hypothetical protein